MPPLKHVLPSLDGLDELTAKLYRKAEDGKFRLDVEGVVDKEKLDVFRDANIALTEGAKKLQEQLDAFKGIDPTKFREMSDKLSNDEEKKLIEKGNLDEVIRLRTERMKVEHGEQLVAKEKQIQKLTAERTTAYKERDEKIIDIELRRAVENPELGFHPGSADILKPHVLQEFTYRDGKIVRVKPDGSVVFGKEGEPATLNEYLADTAKQKPFMIKPSNGSGASNGNGSNGTTANGKTMKRSAFEGLLPQARSEFIKTGGVPID